MGRGRVEEDTSWEGLRRELALRHDLGLRWTRRVDHPPMDDPIMVPLLLRQASLLVDAGVQRVLAGRTPVLTPMAVDLLRHLARRPSSGVDSARYLRIRPQRASELLGRLEADGLVERTGAREDRRADRVGTTERGRALLAEVDRDLAPLVEEWLEDHGRGARAVLLHLLACLAEDA